MDLTTTTTTTPTPTPTKSADSENDTPPHVQPIKSLSFTNGAIKKHNFHRHRHRQPPPEVVVTYKDCLKNHAASIGGHAVDGCGEFMPCSTANPTDPTSLKCAACGCHRNFHRREPDEYCAPTIATTATTTHFLDFQRHAPPPPPSGRFSSSPSPPPPPPPPQPSSYSPPNMLLALSTAVHDELQPMNHHHHHVATPMTPTTLKGETNSSGRKRFRTRFTQEQKEKMHSFAEKLGWKMQKTDEAIIEEFCDEIGVARGVLKVWMHNNKHTSAKKDINHSSIINMNNNNGIQNGRVISFQNNDYNDDNKNNDAVHDLHVSANGSSSSS